MGNETLHVRGIDRDAWRQIRAEAVKRGQNVGDLLNEIIKEWLARQEGK